MLQWIESKWGDTMSNTTLIDFEPEKIKARELKKSEDHKIMDLIGRFTAEMLMEALRRENGHPKPEWGDGDTWRFYYLNECRRRGLRLLQQLGWPTDDKAEYVNLHTGSVEVLWEIATSHGYLADKHTVADQVWSVIEHWAPYNPEKPNLFLIKYLEDEIDRLRKIKARDKLDSYQRGEIKRIHEHEEEIKLEKEKAAIHR